MLQSGDMLCGWGSLRVGAAAGRNVKKYENVVGRAGSGGLTASRWDFLRGGTCVF